ncbi:MAG TPA: radical SAM protein [Candidatus Bathyarchaeia archaeon]|nr:radical SAM protein [Candidatus Bathyarchaeia archaeon]
MELIAKYGREDLAVLYITKEDKKYIEFVESLQPPVPREKKWVLIISTMYGCPVRCSMCDAGTYYLGKIPTAVMLKQIDYMVSNRFPDNKIPVEKFKIQFARMGEPALNLDVLDVMRQLPEIYDAPGLMPCISTIAPKKAHKFLYDLIQVKNDLYSHGQFQLQFSIHSTDENTRKKIIPYKIWSLKEIAEYSNSFWNKGDRKITLNFASERSNPLDPEKLIEIFDPKKFFVKITPINPTGIAKAHSLQSMISVETGELAKQKIKQIEDKGFEVLLSIGEIEENHIGSNCGQHALKFQNGSYMIETYQEFQET